MSKVVEILNLETVPPTTLIDMIVIIHINTIGQYTRKYAMPYKNINIVINFKFQLLF